MAVARPALGCQGANGGADVHKGPLLAHRQAARDSAGGAQHLGGQRAAEQQVGHVHAVEVGLDVADAAPCGGGGEEHGDSGGGNGETDVDGCEKGKGRRRPVAEQQRAGGEVLHARHVLHCEVDEQRRARHGHPQKEAGQPAGKAIAGARQAGGVWRCALELLVI